MMEEQLLKITQSLVEMVAKRISKYYSEKVDCSPFEIEKLCFFLGMGFGHYLSSMEKAFEKRTLWLEFRRGVEAHQGLEDLGATRNTVYWDIREHDKTPSA